VSHLPLEVFVQREIYKPLKMRDTGYLPPASRLPRIAPTEVVDGKPWRGVVHDPTARKMGGVAGHAGLFITASDMARYARMLLNGGKLGHVRIFKPETVKLMTTVQTPPGMEDRRGLGWDIDTGFSGPRGNLFWKESYGHTGWTGGSLWIDPASKTFVIFLSNRNHPTEAGNVLPLRHKLGTLAAQAVADFDFSHPPAQ
jgi:CubicO group peptidase (beta-lactamase class C family)